MRSTRPARELVVWRNAIYVIFILSGLGISSWIARIPGVRDQLHLSTSGVGLLLLGLSGGAIVGLALAPSFMSWFGARHGMVYSLVILAVGIILIGLGATLLTSIPMVAAGLVLLGFGNGAVDVIMNVEGAAVEHEIGKTLMPFMHGCFSIGTVVGAGIGAAAAAANIAILWHLIGIAIILIAASIVAVAYVPERNDLADTTSTDTGGSAVSLDSGALAITTLAAPTSGWRDKLRSSLSVWADWRLIMIGMVMLGMSFTEGTANDWVALATVDGHHQSNATGAVVFGIFVSAMTVGRMLGGPVVDRIGRVAAIRITAVLGVAGLLLFILGGPLWVVVIGTALWGIGSALGFPLGMSAAADGTKNAAARVSAVAMIGYCAFLIGPPVLGFLGQHFGILNALFLIVGLLFLSLIASSSVRERTGPHAR